MIDRNTKKNEIEKQKEVNCILIPVESFWYIQHISCSGGNHPMQTKPEKKEKIEIKGENIKVASHPKQASRTTKKRLQNIRQKSRSKTSIVQETRKEEKRKRNGSQYKQKDTYS